MIADDDKMVIFFNTLSSTKVQVKSLSRVQLFATPWTIAYQAPLSMGFSRQEYWAKTPNTHFIPKQEMNVLRV